MLYLEDYLELIEHLPQEIRDKCTTMRELDLNVQNCLDSLDTRIKNYFQSRGACKNESARNLFHGEHESILKEYSRIAEDADDKIQLATNICELVDRYKRRLDQDVQRFRLELEADNAGITELLENKVKKELADEEIRSRKKRKLHYQSQFSSNCLTTINGTSVVRSSAPLSSRQLTGISSPVSSSLHKNRKVRRRFLPTSYIPSLATKKNKNSAYTSEHNYEALESPLSSSSPFSPSESLSVSSTTGTNLLSHPTLPSDEADEPADEAVEGAEQRWCLCNEFSYGQMVACDNRHCPIEWFHYGCVGLQCAPRGKWYCPRCKSSFKKKMKTS